MQYKLYTHTETLRKKLGVFHFTGFNKRVDDNKKPPANTPDHKEAAEFKKVYAIT
jgi:hypothetical protein